VHIGYFTQELDAALAYDAAAREALRGICPHKPSPEIACIGIPLASTPTEYPRNPFGMIGRP